MNWNNMHTDDSDIQVDKLHKTQIVVKIIGKYKLKK